MSDVTAIRTVGVPVTDQERALEFYVGTLGLEKRLDATLPDGSRWIEVAPSGGGAGVALVRETERVPTETGIRFATRHADTAWRRLKASGVKVGEVLRWPGVPPMFQLRDQDGNGLVIIEES